MSEYIVIAAFNEEKHIQKVLRETKRLCENIIVVDDGSSDATYELAKKEGVIALRHVINLGKGAAIKTGCDYATRAGAKMLILMDADGQHEPADIPRFREALRDNDIVFGYRKLNRSMPKVYRLGNFSINLMSQILFGIKIRDTQCGYRAMTANAYRRVRWDATDYSMESEMIANAGRHDLRYKEIEIKTQYHDNYKGTTVIDGLKIGFNMIRWRITR
ncbi:MAG: glycosyltransferase family 2 protein [Candidatus Woesearchaeota archaeon]